MDPGAKLDITPLAVLAKPLPDGNWEVTSDACRADRSSSTVRRAISR